MKFEYNLFECFQKPKVKEDNIMVLRIHLDLECAAEERQERDDRFNI
ncbi:MAG: hypothetical protein ACFFKA_13155 [Candidatus Thorarchaeota archaeon]